LEKWIKPKGVLIIFAFQPSKYSDVKGITKEKMMEYFRKSFLWSRVQRFKLLLRSYSRQNRIFLEA
jgi:hypothetical protein